MQHAALFETFDGEHFGVLALNGEHGAGFDGHAVEIDRARAAVTRFAADMRPRSPELLTERMNEEFTRLDDDVHDFAVELDRHRLFGSHVVILPLLQTAARERAVRNARCVISPAIAVLYSALPR